MSTVLSILTASTISCILIILVYIYSHCCCSFLFLQQTALPSQIIPLLVVWDCVAGKVSCMRIYFTPLMLGLVTCLLSFWQPKRQDSWHWKPGSRSLKSLQIGPELGLDKDSYLGHDPRMKTTCCLDRSRMQQSWDSWYTCRERNHYCYYTQWKVLTYFLWQSRPNKKMSLINFLLDSSSEYSLLTSKPKHPTLQD